MRLNQHQVAWMKRVVAAHGQLTLTGGPGIQMQARTKIFFEDNGIMGIVHGYNGGVFFVRYTITKHGRDLLAKRENNSLQRRQVAV